jgi:hypothetical protein
MQDEDTMSRNGAEPLLGNTRYLKIQDINRGSYGFVQLAYDRIAKEKVRSPRLFQAWLHAVPEKHCLSCMMLKPALHFYVSWHKTCGWLLDHPLIEGFHRNMRTSPTIAGISWRSGVKSCSRGLTQNMHMQHHFSRGLGN